jgi:hypothetical protein
VTTTPGVAGSARARLRLGAVLVLAALAAVWAVLAVRLYFLPPAGVSPTVAALLGLLSGLNAVAYGLAGRWVALRRRWGQFVAIALVALNVLLGITAGMTWLEWSVLALNLVALGLLAATVPRRS